MGDVTGNTGGWLHRSTTDTFCLPRLNKSDVAPRNRALDPRSLESPSPIFKTLILSLVSFSQTVRLPLSISTCCAGRSTHPYMSTFISLSLTWKIESAHGCLRLQTNTTGLVFVFSLSIFVNLLMLITILWLWRRMSLFERNTH